MSKISAHHFLGLTTEAAMSLAKKHEIRYRVSKKDGVYHILTQDYRPDRVNVDIRDDIIVRAGYG